MSHGPSAELVALTETLRSMQAALLASPLSDQRTSVDAMGLLWPVPTDVKVVASPVGGVPVERVTAPGADSGRVIIHLHGGGYVIGSSVSHRSLAARLSRQARATVVVPSYRLAPEHRFPAAVDDVGAVYRVVLEELGHAGRLALSGDSAGGGLVLSTMVAARDQGLALPAAAVCWSPWVDLRRASLPASPGEGGTDDPVLSVEWLAATAALYLGDTDPADPAASPLGADLTGMPPLLVMVGTAELLRAQAHELAAAAAGAGVVVELEEFPGAMHWWMLLAPDAPESHASVARAGRFIRSLTGP